MAEKISTLKTSSEISAWIEELHELEATASAGTPLSDEEYEQQLQSVIDGSCFKKYLNKVLRHKQKLLQKLAEVEETEKMLRDIIASQKQA